MTTLRGTSTPLAGRTGDAVSDGRGHGTKMAAIMSTPKVPLTSTKRNTRGNPKATWKSSRGFPHEWRGSLFVLMRHWFTSLFSANATKEG